MDSGGFSLHTNEWTISPLLWGLGTPQDIPQKDLEKLKVFPIKQVPGVKLEKPKCKRDFRQKSTIDHKPTSLEKNMLPLSIESAPRLKSLIVPAWTQDFGVHSVHKPVENPHSSHRPLKKKDRLRICVHRKEVPAKYDRSMSQISQNKYE